MNAQDSFEIVLRITLDLMPYPRLPIHLDTPSLRETSALAIAVALSNLGCHKYNMKSGLESSTPTSNVGNTSNNTAANSNETKYKLYYAAAKTNDKAIEIEVGQKLGINDAAGHPTEYS